MVYDSECMMTDPVSMLERCEREKAEALLERRQQVERCYQISVPEVCNLVSSRIRAFSVHRAHSHGLC
jgi:hypothetical protein